MKHDGPIYASGVMRCGRLRLRRSELFATQLHQLRDGEVEIRIERRKATRNQQQNRFYWAVVIAALADHTGYSPEEMHEICKAQFLPRHLSVAKNNGEIVGEFVIGGTTTQLSVGEFAAYLDAIQAWAATLGVVLPSESEAA
jgi:hypothetical protein